MCLRWMNLTEEEFLGEISLENIFKAIKPEIFLESDPGLLEKHKQKKNEQTKKSFPQNEKMWLKPDFQKVRTLNSFDKFSLHFSLTSCKKQVQSLRQRRCWFRKHLKSTSAWPIHLKTTFGKLLTFWTNLFFSTPSTFARQDRQINIIP